MLLPAGTLAAAVLLLLSPGTVRGGPMDEPVKALVAWLQEPPAADLSKIDIVATQAGDVVDEYMLPLDPLETPFTVRAATAVAHELSESLFSMPRAKVLTVLDVRASPFGALLRERLSADVLGVVEERDALVLALAIHAARYVHAVPEEKAGADVIAWLKQWRPLAQALPFRPLSPVTFAQEEMKAMQGSLSNLVYASGQGLLRISDAICPSIVKDTQILHGSLCQLDTLAGLLAAVRASSVGVADDDAQALAVIDSMALLPLASGILPSLDVTHLWSVQPPDSIAGDVAVEQLHEFALAKGDTARRFVTGMVTDVPSAAELLTKSALSYVHPAHNFVIVSLQRKGRELDENKVQALKKAMLPTDLQFKLKARRWPEDLQEALGILSPVDGNGEPATPKTILATMARLVHSHLAGFPTTIDADRELLAAGGLSRAMQAIIRVRLGEKEILLDNFTQIRDRLAALEEKEKGEKEDL